MYATVHRLVGTTLAGHERRNNEDRHDRSAASHLLKLPFHLCSPHRQSVQLGSVLLDLTPNNAHHLGPVVAVIVRGAPLRPHGEGKTWHWQKTEPVGETASTLQKGTDFIVAFSLNDSVGLPGLNSMDK